MKRQLLPLLIALVPVLGFAQSAPKPQAVTKGVLESAGLYAAAIACERPTLTAKNVAALSPYTSPRNRDSAEYVVIWEGDIGCAGGSGTATTNMTIVRVRTGDSYVVDVTKSSPIIGFPGRNFTNFAAKSKNSILLESLDYGPKDPNCCPSLVKKTELRRDSKGNWK